MKTMNPRKNEDLQRNLPHPEGWGSAPGILENRRIGALRMGSTSVVRQLKSVEKLYHQTVSPDILEITLKNI